jgi:hypothetical protein
MPAVRPLIWGGGFYIWEAKDYIVCFYFRPSRQAQQQRLRQRGYPLETCISCMYTSANVSRRARPLEFDARSWQTWFPRSASQCKFWRLSSPAVCKICGHRPPLFAVSLCIYESLPVDPDVHQELMEPGSRPIGCAGSDRAWFGPSTTGLRVTGKTASRLRHPLSRIGPGGVSVDRSSCAATSSRLLGTGCSATAVPEAVGAVLAHAKLGG